MRCGACGGDCDVTAQQCAQCGAALQGVEVAQIRRCSACTQESVEETCPRCGSFTVVDGLPSASAPDPGRPQPTSPVRAPVPSQAMARRGPEPKPPEDAVEGEVVDIDLAPKLPTAEPIRSTQGDQSQDRLSTGIETVDVFFGGGFEKGAVIMLDGEPGAGKTTLLLQIGEAFTRANPGYSVLYVSGEQNGGAIDATAARLGIEYNEHFLRVTTNRWEHVQQMLDIYEPGLLILDAIQVFRVPWIKQPAGDVAQVRAVSVRAVTAAKVMVMVTIIVVHHNKEKGFAGPKVLEHLVDASASLVHHPGSDLRKLVQPKNRGADTSEALFLTMTSRGLAPVPASNFIEERSDSPGSVVLAAVAGTQTLFGLVQVLVLVAAEALGDEELASDDEVEQPSREITAPRKPAKPRRRVRVGHVLGLDPKRIGMVCGVLSQHTRLDLYDCELLVQLAGGLEVEDPASDIAVVLAIGSSRLSRPVPHHVCAFGEVGLGGEIRSVPRVAQRLRAAAKQGFTSAVVPDTRRVREEGRDCGLELIFVRTVEDAIRWVYGLPKAEYKALELTQ